MVSSGRKVKDGPGTLAHRSLAWGMGPEDLDGGGGTLPPSGAGWGETLAFCSAQGPLLHSSPPALLSTCLPCSSVSLFSACPPAWQPYWAFRGPRLQ